MTTTPQHDWFYPILPSALVTGPETMGVYSRHGPNPNNITIDETNKDMLHSEVLVNSKLTALHHS